MKHQKLLDSINNTIEKKGNDGWKARTISSSVIGSKCDRELWLNFRHCQNKNNDFDSESLRRFEDGHVIEDITAQRWIDAGIQLQTLDYETKKQIQVNAQGGWGKGKLDGIIHGGVPEFETEKFVWEGKCAKSFPTKKQQEDENTCLLNWNLKYYAQAQDYMGLTGIHKHLTSICKPGSRDEIIIETGFDPVFFKDQQDRRERLITSDKMPQQRISDRPDYYECKMCSVSDTCHKGYIPEPSCRNCAFITFQTDGNQRATCTKHNQDMPNVKSMEKYYACHRYNADLIPADPISFDQETGSVTYRDNESNTFVNGEGYGEFKSDELYLAQTGGLLYDGILKAVKEEFGSTLINAEEFYKE